MARSKKPAPPKAKQAKKPAKKPIEQYEHKDKTRANNPPVGRSPGTVVMRRQRAMVFADVWTTKTLSSIRLENATSRQ
jgi:hypothetical protein